MSVVRHLGFLTVRNFNCSSISLDKVCHCAKRCANRSNRCRDMAILDFSRWRPAPFWIFYFGNSPKGQECRTASPCHISWWSVTPFPRYDDFSIFPRWRPSDMHLIWHSCRICGRNHLWHFFGDRLRGVDSVGVENCPFPLTKPVAINTGLALPCSLWNASICQFLLALQSRPYKDSKK